MKQRGYDFWGQEEPAICYPFPLRPDLIAQVLVPRNLSKPEADRLCDFVRSLATPDAAPATT